MLTHNNSQDRPECRLQKTGNRLSALGLAVLTLSIALAIGCVDRKDSHDQVLSPDEDFNLREFTFDNARFEPFLTEPWHPFTGRYWLRKGDQMALRWDTFELHWQRVGLRNACPFFDNNSTADCYVCETCIVAKENRDFRPPPCFGAQPVFDHPDSIVSLSNFFHDSMPVPIGGLVFQDYLRGCAHRTDPITIQPASDAIYQLRLPLNIPVQFSAISVVTEKEIHVIPAGGSTNTAYQLTSTVVDGRQYWSWSTDSIAAGSNPDAFWRENFSPHLRVSEVRVFRGVCEYAPNTGICEHLFESSPVRPSRVFFIPSFTNSISNYPAERDYRCYQDPAKLDFISLDLCRQTFSPNSLQTVPKVLTPTFMMGRELEKVTWFVEFNTGEGGDANLRTPCDFATGTGCEGLNANEQLVIEFTIAAS